MSSGGGKNVLFQEKNNDIYFEKTTSGKQFARAADSMAFNIAEGYGRFFLKRTDNSVTTAVGPQKKLKQPWQMLKNVV